MEEQRPRFGSPEASPGIMATYLGSPTTSFFDPHARQEGEMAGLNRAQRRALKKKRKATKAGRKTNR